MRNNFSAQIPFGTGFFSHFVSHRNPPQQGVMPLKLRRKNSLEYSLLRPFPAEDNLKTSLLSRFHRRHDSKRITGRSSCIHAGNNNPVRPNHRSSTLQDFRALPNFDFFATSDRGITENWPCEGGKKRAGSERARRKNQKTNKMTCSAAHAGRHSIRYDKNSSIRSKAAFNTSKPAANEART